jgi:hypothetical protein
VDIKKDDYIEGYEYYGSTIKKIKGWVDKVGTMDDYLYFNIQADDNWKGARGTSICTDLGEVVKLDHKERIK